MGLQVQTVCTLCQQSMAGSSLGCCGGGQIAAVAPRKNTSRIAPFLRPGFLAFYNYCRQDRVANGHADKPSLQLMLKY